MLVQNVNSSARCFVNSTAINCRMEKELEDWQIEDAERLKKLFEAHATKSQQAFGLDSEIGTQGMVWQYLNARRALNLDALFKFAQGLGVEAKIISPTLWKKVEASLVGAQSGPALTEEQKNWLLLLDKIKDEAKEPFLRVGELLAKPANDRREQNVVPHEGRRRFDFEGSKSFGFEKAPDSETKRKTE